jgi:hypothetical protein
VLADGLAAVRSACGEKVGHALERKHRPEIACSSG